MKPLPKRIKTTSLHPADLQGLNRLVVDAIAGITELAETVHLNVLRMDPPPETSIQPLTGGIRLIYRSVWQVTSLVSAVLDTVIQRLIPLLEPSGSSFTREAVLAALNGVLGDYLEETDSPLAIPMQFRQQGQPLILKKAHLAEAYPTATHKIMVLAHGLCMNDLQWGREATDLTGDGERVHYADLAREMGFTPVYLHYNTGRHISTNGHEFASLLETLKRQWPVRVKEIVIVAHSMGGLITRSACYYGAQSHCRWLRKLKTIVFLGTPHQGSPLERSGNLVDHTLESNPYTAPFARIGKIRSAGITDLRYGYLLDEDWQGKDRFERHGHHRREVPLPRKVHCYAVAATTSKKPGQMAELVGDGLVPVNSALGRHRKGETALEIPPSHQWIAYGTSHLGLLSQPAVFEHVKSWLEGKVNATEKTPPDSVA
ncbi:hypothetical protein QQM79_02365 [Marinobacteraceae bacterium S3BR75-40.1]